MAPHARSLAEGDPLPHECAADLLWDTNDDSWVQSPRAPRSVTRIIGGVLLILVGANTGQVALFSAIALIPALLMRGGGPAVTSAAISLAVSGTVSAFCLWAGVKLVSGKPAERR